MGASSSRTHVAKAGSRSGGGVGGGGGENCGSLKDHLQGETAKSRKCFQNSPNTQKQAEEKNKNQPHPSRWSSPPEAPLLRRVSGPLRSVSRSRNRKDTEAAAGSTSSALAAPIFRERADTPTTPTSNGSWRQRRSVTHRSQRAEVNPDLPDPPSVTRWQR